MNTFIIKKTNDHPDYLITSTNEFLLVEERVSDKDEWKNIVELGKCELFKGK